MGKQLRQLTGIEVFASGVWNGDKWTDEQLEEMVKNFNELKGVLDPPFKLGHSDKQEIAGKPAIGWIHNLYKQGNKLIADIKDIPANVYDLIVNKAYRKVSSEIMPKFRHESGKMYDNVFCGLALLGEELPAVSSLKSIEALYAQREGIKCYEFNLTGGEKDMDRIEELTKQLADKDIELKKFEVEVAELKKTETELADAQKAVADKDVEIKAKDEEVAKMKSELKAIELSKVEGEDNAFIDEAVKSEKVMPKQKDVLVSIFKALREQSAPVLKYSVDGKEEEKSMRDVLKSYITDSPKLNLLETFSEKGEEGKEKTDAKEFSSIDDAAKHFATEDKVSYGLGMKKAYAQIKNGSIVITDKK